MSRLYNVLNAIAKRTRQMEMGGIAATTVPANSYVDVSVTFTQTWSDAPTVFPVIYSKSTAGAAALLSCSAVDVTTTGFTLRVFNADSSSRSPAFRWLAVGAWLA